MTASRTHERLTVNLTQKASEALAAAAGREDLTRTDTVNRALQLYDYVSELRSGGGDLLVRESKDGQLMIVKLA